MLRDLLKPLYSVVALGLVLFALTANFYLQGSAIDADVNACKPVSMYPSYARLRSFNESHTPLASKYSLYLYREQGKDRAPKEVGKGFQTLDGIPVLFIPGNAGSYRQARSIAAECSNMFFDRSGRFRQQFGSLTQNLDFFSADFNEDFTAFHGRTLLDQAHYLNDAVRFVLSLYSAQPQPPESVIIVAHSMGGIVARVMPTLPNYVPESINTIVTLSSPHAAAPLTFDGDILRIYSATDRFWHESFFVPESPHYGQLDDVCLISITGGLTDAILPADYTALGFLVPPSNGFTAYTTGIPGVWTPMDHLAIVWCRQLRRAIARSLLLITDKSSPQKVVSLQERMAFFADNFLSGFEDYTVHDSVPLRSPKRWFRVLFDARDSVVEIGLNSNWKSSRDQSESRLISLLPVSGNSTLSVLEDSYRKDRRPNVGTNFAVYLCKSDGSSDGTLNFTRTDTQQFMEVFCVDTFPDYKQVPRSAADVSALADSALDGGKSPFKALHYKGEQLQDFEFAMIVDQKHPKDAGFAIVQTSEAKYSEHKLSADMRSLIMRGVEVSFLPNRPLAINLNIPGAWSSLLAYNVKLKETSGDLFEPFIRQWVDDPYETKWHINLRGSKQFSLSIHSVAPYTPFERKKLDQGMNLQIWSDPQGGWSEEEVAAVEIVISVDWLDSLRLLVMRYRLAVVSHCLAVTILVALFQFSKLASTGRFPDYIYGLSRLTDAEVFLPIFIGLCVLTPLVKLRPVQVLLNAIDPVAIRDPSEINVSLHKEFTLNAFYLGLEENWLSFLGGFFFMMAIGLNYLAYNVLLGVGNLIVLLGSSGSRLLKRQATKDAQTGKPAGQVLKSKLIGSALLLLAVPFYLPYQFAFIICYGIQINTCIKSLWEKQSKTFWNYNVSVLMMMTWVLPINVPVLIVFVHNFNVNWATPFSSHHNFLAVAPILALVEIHSYYGCFLPLKEEKPVEGKTLLQKTNSKLLLYTAVYSLIYGVRHTYWLHHLFNFWCCGMVLVFVEKMMANAEKQQ